MYCKNCGKELTDDAVFCPVCGVKQTKNIDGGKDFENAGRELNQNESDEKAESQKHSSRNNFIFRVWNSEQFTTIAIKFGDLLEILLGIIFILLSRMLFKEGGFWGNGFGIFFLIGGVISCIGSAISLLLFWKKKDITAGLDEKSVNKKKRNLCIGLVVIVTALVVLKNSGGGTYYIVQSVSFDNLGSETIGELIDKNIKSPEWSQKKLDGSSRLVYVEGYYPAYSETIRIEFYLEKLDDGSHEVTLNGMSLPDTGEDLDGLETSIMWASFYQ